MKIEEIYGGNIIINKFKIMVVAAGTGGHIYPGLAISEHFLKQSIPVSWVGTPKGMENRLVDKYKIPFYSISISGIRGKGLLPWIKLPFMLFRSILQSITALRVDKPDYVIIMGGYIGIPMAIASRIFGIHLIIHEQNAIPGLANKVISKFASQIFCGFENILKGPLIMPRSVSKEAIDLIVKLLNRFPQRRLGSGAGGSKDIMDHPFFAKIDWNKVKNREMNPPKP